MRTRILTTTKIKQFLIESLLNKTDKISKISDNSIVNGVCYGLAKLHQKSQKDSAVIESELFPEVASEIDLDIVALRSGTLARLGPTESTTYMRVAATPGTIYSAEQNVFVSSDGLRFKASKDWVIGSSGYEYVNVKCLSQGSNTNVLPNTINKILAPPTGHIFCTNEFISLGGRDSEDDLSLRTRIQKSANYLSTDTLSRISQLLIEINRRILSVKKVGRTYKGVIQLSVITQNGENLSVEEKSEIYSKLPDLLSLTSLEIKRERDLKIEIVDIDYTYVDVDFRVDIQQSYDLSTYITEIQISLSKYLDWRFWDRDKKVEWDTLFLLIKNHQATKYLPDQYFTPNADISVRSNSLPRLRGFIIRNLSGEIISSSDTIKPVYYQTQLENSGVSYLTNI